jgi:hypothetical protein
MIGMGVRHHERLDRLDLPGAQERLDDRGAGVEVGAGEPAGVHDEDPPARQLDDRRIALPDVEERDAQTAARRPLGRPPAGVDGEQEQGGDRHETPERPAACRVPEQRPVEEAELDHVGQRDVDRRPAPPADHAHDRERRPDRKGREHHGRVRRRRSQRCQDRAREPGQHREPLEQRHDQGVRDHAHQRDLVKVERRQGCGPDPRGPRGAPGTPEPSPPVRAGVVARRARDQRADRREGELIGDLTGRARLDQGDADCRQREDAERVGLAIEQHGRDDDRRHDERAERRDGEPGETTVRERHGEAADDRDLSPVDAEEQPLAAAEEPGDRRRCRRRDHADVEAGDREDVDHAGAGERAADVVGNAALVAEDEGRQHRCRVGRVDRVDRVPNGVTPGVERGERCRNRVAAEPLDRGRVPDRRDDVDAAPSERRDHVEAAGVREVARATERRRDGDEVATCERDRAVDADANASPYPTAGRRLGDVDDEDRPPLVGEGSLRDTSDDARAHRQGQVRDVSRIVGHAPGLRHEKRADDGRAERDRDGTCPASPSPRCPPERGTRRESGQRGTGHAEARLRARADEELSRHQPHRRPFDERTRPHVVSPGGGARSVFATRPTAP